MNPDVIVPVVALISVFGMPVAILFVLRHFKIKERELQLESGLGADDAKRLEERLDRIEKRLASLDTEVRKALPAGSGPSPQLPPPRDE